MQRASATTSRAVAAALLTDVVCVLAFCTVGRRSHAEGITVAGIVETAWPFLSGTAIGWLAARAWQRPTSLAPTGIVIWLSTVIIGMLVRRASSQGTAISFVVVASLSTAILLLGWRLGAKALARH
jgi:hypothetical protein